jgi:Raf kinase inhibitor-like YbhB/YbcL family protein
MGWKETLFTPLGFLLRKKRAGEGMSIQHYKELKTDRQFSLFSRSFSNGKEIPDLHAGLGRGANVSPELHWEGVPNGTKQFLLVIEDIDVPMEKPILHGIILFSQGIFEISEGGLTAENQLLRCVPSRKGRLGYFGPRALPGHGIHRYWFHLYALDQEVDKDLGISSFEELLPYVENHVLARATLEGIQVGK